MELCLDWASLLVFYTKYTNHLTPNPISCLMFSYSLAYRLVYGLCIGVYTGVLY